MTQPLFQRVLGSDAFARLAPAVRDLHAQSAPHQVCGTGTIRRGRHWLVPLLAWLTRMPPDGEGIDVTVRFVPDAVGETWQRRFGVSPLVSRLSMRGPYLAERLGVVGLRFTLEERNGRIYWQCVGGTVLGVLPLPGRLLDHVRCREREHRGRYEYLVDVMLPIMGPFIRYEGWLEPAGSSDDV